MPVLLCLSFREHFAKMAGAQGSCPTRESGESLRIPSRAYQYLIILREVFERGAAAADYAGDGVFGGIDGEVGFLTQAFFEAAQEGAAAGEDDAPVENV